MKKFFILFFAAAGFLLSAVTAGAQHHFGVKAGLNISSLNRESVKDNLGYQAGIAYQLELPLWLSVQPELMFHIKGSRIENIRNGAFGLGYLEIPVNLQWGPYFHDRDIRVFLQASPFLGYAISKDLKDQSGEQYSWKGINRFEYGAGAGFGIQLWKLQVAAQYNWNFGHLAKGEFADKVLTEIFSRSNFSGYTISLGLLF